MAKVVKMVILRVALIIGQMYWIINLMALIYDKNEKIKKLEKKVQIMEVIIDA